MMLPNVNYSCQTAALLQQDYGKTFTCAYYLWSEQFFLTQTTQTLYSH